MINNTPNEATPADFLRMVADDVTQLGQGNTAHNLREVALRFETMERELAPTDTFRAWCRVRYGDKVLLELKSFDLVDIEEAYAAGQRSAVAGQRSVK